MSVATVNPAAVPLPRQHLNRLHRHSSYQTSSTTTTKGMRPSPRHPFTHGYHRRRLASPNSPLSTVYNPRSPNKTNEAVIAACDREVLWEVESVYGETIKKNMKDSEERFMASAEMMDLQPELDWSMLPFLVDFMIEVHLQFRMSPHTLHLAVNLVNRYVSKRVVFRKHYQLVGLTALWIAAKFEDSKEKVPTVRDLRNTCVNTYEEDMFVQMEGHVLATLGWELGGVPTCETFAAHQITRLRGRHGHVDCRIVHLTRFFLELTLFGREFLAFKPSEVAVASVALARHILGSQQFLQQDYTDAEIDCVEQLLYCLPSASIIVRHKYSLKKFRNITSIIDSFLAQAARDECQQPTTPSSSQSQQCHSRCASEVQAPELYIRLPDTPPHTPVTAPTVPAAKMPGYFVNGAGLPTPPADDDNNKTMHMLSNDYNRGSYRRSESYVIDSPADSLVIVEAQDEDMDTEYESDDEDMTYADDYDDDFVDSDETVEVDYDFDSDSDEEDAMMMDPYHDHHYFASHHNIASRMALACVA